MIIDKHREYLHTFQKGHEKRTPPTNYHLKYKTAFYTYQKTVSIYLAKGTTFCKFTR
jgi:hypothetical protein